MEGIRIALEAIFLNRFRSGLTMLGVIIGVASIILLVSIGEGAKAYITGQFQSLGTNVLIILPGRQETTGGAPMVASSIHPLTYDDAVAIERRVPAVRQVAPMLIGSGPVKFANRTRDTTIIGTVAAFEEVRNLHVEVGHFLPPMERLDFQRVVVLGRKVRDALFGDRNPLGEFVRINQTRFRVIGIMEQRGRSLGFDIDDLVFVPLGASMKLFERDELFECLATAWSKEGIGTARDQIRDILLARHRVEDFTVIDQGEMLQTFDVVLSTLTYVLGGIAAISLIVGGIGIMNIMLVSVTERTREIGIRKAVGARRRDIQWQFLIESVTISGTGGIAGVAIGVGGAFGISFAFPALPTSISLWMVFLAFGFSLATGVFFGVYPAAKAASLDPIEALRHE